MDLSVWLSHTHTSVLSVFSERLLVLALFVSQLLALSHVHFSCMHEIPFCSITKGCRVSRIPSFSPSLSLSHDLALSNVILTVKWRNSEFGALAYFAYEDVARLHNNDVDESQNDDDAVNI